MKITSVNIPKSANNNDGLEHIKMDRLDNVVLLAGKNGSGKTRILNKIFTTLASKPKEEPDATRFARPTEWTLVKTDPQLAHDYPYVHFVPKSLDLIDCNKAFAKKCYTHHGC